MEFVRGAAIVVIALLTVLWALFGLWFSYGVTNIAWDGECAAATPVWSLSQAAIAAAGVVTAGRIIWTSLRPGARTRLSVWGGMWLAWLLLWLLVIVLAHPESRPLPVSACYGDEM